MKMSDSKTEEEPTEVKDELDVKIKDLIAICTEVQDVMCSGKKQQPHWSVCVNKLQSVYERVGKSEGFRDMFVEFHRRFGSKYSTPIFTYVDDDDDGTVEDDFFTDDTIMPKPGEDNTVNIKIAGKKESKKR